MDKPFVAGVTVANAIRLNAAWTDLLDIYFVSELTAADKASIAFQRYQSQLENGEGVGLTDEWVRHCTLQALAAQSLDQALVTGTLAAWVILADFQERPLDSSAFIWAALPENESSVVKSGIFHAQGQYLESIFNGAPLFLKQPDWDAFRARARADRHGMPPPNAPENNASVFSDSERRQWMIDCSICNADSAHKAFKNEPRYDGTKQATWRSDWRLLKGRSRGRIAAL